MITCYARSLDRDQRQNVLVENGVVVKEFVVDGLFVWKGNPELIGQSEASLEVLGFEQVPGPLKMRWGSWVNITLEDMKRDEEERAKFHKESVKDALKIFDTAIHIHVLKFHPVLGKKDWFAVEEWHVTEGDIIRAGEPLVTIECALCSFTLPVPPQADMYRVERLCVPAGGATHLGELIVVLEQSTLEDPSQVLPQGKAEPPNQEGV